MSLPTIVTASIWLFSALSINSEKAIGAAAFCRALGEKPFIITLKSMKATSQNIIFFIGFIIWKSMNNYLSMLAVVLVLPAGKFSVSYFVLIPHKNCDEELKSAIEERIGELNSV